jgi:hypothetical protein
MSDGERAGESLRYSSQAASATLAFFRAVKFELRRIDDLAMEPTLPSTRLPKTRINTMSLLW